MNSNALFISVSASALPPRSLGAFSCHSLTTAARAKNYKAKTTVTMRSCTIIKALVLSLGAIAVVARSLPQQRSEINGRAAGEDELGIYGKHFDISKPSHSYLSFPKGRLEANAALSKHDKDLRGATCEKTCVLHGRIERNRDDCTTLYERLSAEPYKMITVKPSTSSFLSHFPRIVTPD